MRGFRWQLLALVMAVMLFAVSLASRTPQTGDIVESEVETPTQAVELPTATPPPPADSQSPPSVAEPVSLPQPIPGSTFREGLVGSFQRINPLLTDLNEIDRDISALIFEGLTRINEYGEPEPALAESWVTSSDGLEYVVQLRTDVRWQDGIPFTADDVAYTMSILRSPDFPGLPALGAFWRTVETEILGQHLVRFRLTQPLGSFPDKLRIGLLPAHALIGTSAAQLATHPFNLAPIGTGPYQLEALRTDASGMRVVTVDLRAAPVYRERPESGGQFMLDRLRFKLYPTFDDALQALGEGEIDGLSAPDSSQRIPLLNAAGAAGFNTYTAIEPTIGVLIFNWQREETRFFREQRVRLGLEMGINRGSVVERTLYNRAIRANSPLFPGSWAYLSDLIWPPYDPAAARFLLDTASINRQDEAEEDDSPYLLSFTLLAPDDPAIIAALNELSTQWAQLGVSVAVQPTDPQTYQSRLDAGDFDMALVELALGASADPDLYSFWHQGQYPDGFNFGGVDDRRISETLERARREPSGINRRIHYEAFQREFADRAVALPLYYPLYTYVTAAPVEGVQLGFIGSPADRFRNLGEWTINPAS